MSASDVTFEHRAAVRKVAMHFARAGLSPETIRAAMADLASTEAEHAIAWAAEEDRRWAAAEDVREDREDFAAEYARRAVGT